MSALQKHVDYLTSEAPKLASRFTHSRLDQSQRFAIERRYALEIISKSKQLQQATPESVARCILDAGVMGLSLSPNRRQAYLIPYTDKKSGITTCTLSPSYIGMEQMAYRTGLVELIQTVIVRKGDEFKVSTINNQRSIHHEEGEERGDMTHVYCIAHFANGRTHVEVMRRQEIMAAKDAAARKNSNKVPFTWTGDFRGEMYRKTCLRRAWKFWPHTDERRAEMILRAMSRTDPVDFGEPEGKDDQPQSLTVRDDDVQKMKAVLSESGIPDSAHKSWLKGLASAMGFRTITALPVERIGEAMERLEARAKKVAQKRKGE